MAAKQILFGEQVRLKILQGIGTLADAAIGEMVAEAMHKVGKEGVIPESEF